MTRRFAIALLFACGCSLSAQVIEVRGGSSRLYESQGGSLEIKGGSYDATVGAGTIGPHLLGSAALAKRFNNSTATIGAENIPFNLPTDVFDDDHYLTVLGAGLRSKLPNADVLVFGGLMSQAFEGPFFQGARGEQPAGVFLFDGKVSPRVSVASRMILARQITLIEGVAWRPIKGAQLAASGGIGAGTGYGAVSAKIKYSCVDLKTAYIQTGSGFRRADVNTIVTAEPDRLNAILTVTPSRRFSASASHSGYLTPVAGSIADTRSSVDEVEANTEFKGVGFSASGFHSVYAGGGNKAFVLSSNRQIGPRMRVQASYLYSVSSQGHATTSMVTNISETISPRWSVSQIVSDSNGQSTLGFGTSFLSNLATFSADYETYYLPQHLPSAFEQVLILNTELNLFGRTTLRGGTFVAPDGSVKHTVAAQGIFARQAESTAANERNPMGRYIVIGRVVDRNNQPVEGAALLIDHVPVYTDSDGTFSLRERQAHFHSLEVLGGKFLNGERYRVISAAPNIRSAPSEEKVETIIIVERLPAQCRSDASCKS